MHLMFLRHQPYQTFQRQRVIAGVEHVIGMVARLGVERPVNGYHRSLFRVFGTVFHFL